jgi:hypothetical protein
MKHRGLIALKASSSLDTSKELPNRLLFLKWGSNPSRFGDVKVNEITLAAVPANQALLKFDHVVIDFQHNSVPGTPFYKGEPVNLAARKATVEVVKGEGIYLSAIDWTVDIETVKNYADLSLCPKCDENMNVIFVHSGALCRQGEVDGVTFPLSADPFANQPQPKKESTMDFKKLLLVILGLPETAADAEIEAAAKKLGDKPAADTVALSAAVTEALKPLSAKIEKLEGEGIAQQRQAIQDQAIRDGKVIPLSALPDKDGKGGMEINALRSLVAELPVTVPMDKRTPEGLKSLAASAIPTTTADDSVRTAMGISKEVWDKHNKV